MLEDAEAASEWSVSGNQRLIKKYLGHFRVYDAKRQNKAQLALLAISPPVVDEAIPDESTDSPSMSQDLAAQLSEADGRSLKRKSRRLPNIESAAADIALATSELQHRRTELAKVDQMHRNVSIMLQSTLRDVGMIQERVIPLIALRVRANTTRIINTNSARADYRSEELPRQIKGSRWKRASSILGSRILRCP